VTIKWLCILPIILFSWANEAYWSRLPLYQRHGDDTSDSHFIHHIELPTWRYLTLSKKSFSILYSKLSMIVSLRGNTRVEIEIFLFSVSLFWYPTPSWTLCIILILSGHVILFSINKYNSLIKENTVYSHKFVVEGDTNLQLEKGYKPNLWKAIVLVVTMMSNNISLICGKQLSL